MAWQVPTSGLLRRGGGWVESQRKTSLVSCGRAQLAPDNLAPRDLLVMVTMGREWRQGVTLILFWPRLLTSRWDDAH